MTLEKILEKLRIKIQDISGNQLWSDDELISNINHAFNVACYTANLIYDKTSPLVNFKTIPNQSSYVLDKSIYRIKKVRVGGRLLTEAYMNEIDALNPSGFNIGTISKWYIDEDNSFNLYKCPNLEYNVQIEAYRMPKKLELYEDETEVPEIYIEPALNYACKLCYEKLDVDTNRPDLVVYFENEFVKTFGAPKSARALKEQHKSRLSIVPSRRF